MFFFFKQKTAYEMRISDWSSDVCSSDLFLGLQLADFIAKAPRLLEFQIGCGRAHLLFQILDIGTQIMADHMRAVLQANVDRHLVFAGDMSDDVADMLLHRRRGDAVLLIIGELLFAPAIGLV